MGRSYPFTHHPCWSCNRDGLWARIHLPVAPSCNVKCAYCDHQLDASGHMPVPGRSRRVMTPTQAIEVTLDELGKDPNLRIVAVSGPGEPLACPQTFTTLRGVRDLGVDIEFCLSTNGVLLEEKTKQLVELGAKTISVTMSTVSPETASQIYEWAMIDGRRLTGPEMGEKVIDAQLGGISSATKSGMFVKVNSILIPEMNGEQMGALAIALKDAGARLQNIVPLIPFDNMARERPPAQNELQDARNSASHFMEQFHHCKQCRSDVVGIPGSDRIL